MKRIRRLAGGRNRRTGLEYEGIEGLDWDWTGVRRNRMTGLEYWSRTGAWTCLFPKAYRRADKTVI